MMATRCSSREPVLGWLAISMAHSRDLVENDAGTWTRQIDATRRMCAELPGLAPSLLCLSAGFPFLLFFSASALLKSHPYASTFVNPPSLTRLILLSYWQGFATFGPFSGPATRLMRDRFASSSD